MHEIKLYGEVVPFQDAWIIEQGGYVNLTFLQNRLKEANGQDVLIRINSMGGDVDEGFAFYSELRRYAKDNGAKVTTLAEGRCASIATVFFLAGDERIVTEFTDPFVHNAWTYEMGDKKTFTRVAADLERCDKKIAKHYANHTNLTEEEALILMDAETSISAEDAVALRFATKIEEVLRPVALQKILNSNKMAKRKKGSLKAMFRKAMGFQNKILFTADEREIDFYELEDEDTPKVGDKATIDGANADGEFVMADGKTFVFDDGALTEIKEDAPEGDTAEIQETVEEIQETVEEIQEVLEVIVEEVVPEISNLRKENSRLNAALNKLKGISGEAPKAKHGQSKKNQEKKPDILASIEKFTNSIN